MYVLIMWALDLYRYSIVAHIFFKHACGPFGFRSLSRHDCDRHTCFMIVRCCLTPLKPSVQAISSTWCKYITYTANRN